MLKRFEIIVKGEVQKVAFRQFVRFLAKRYGLHGNVENLMNYDEDVLITLECGEKKADNFLQRLRNPTAEDKTMTVAKISNIIATEKQYTGEFRDKAFKIVSGDNEIQERLDDGLALLKHLQGLYDETSNLAKETKGLRKENKIGFKMIKMETRRGFGKMDGNFKSLGAKIDGNFGSLDKKYGSVSKTLNTMNKNLEKIVAKI